MKEVKCACFGLDLYQFILLTVIFSSWLHWTPKIFGSGDNSIKALSTTCQMPGILLQFSSIAQLCPTLCERMDCSTPGFPVHHHLPEFTQTHVHQVSDAIQPSHPLLSPFPPTFSLSQHLGLF